MTPLAQAISGALLQFIWQGFLVWFPVSATAFLLRKSSPNARYIVYCTGLAVLAVLPVLTAVAIYDPLAGSVPVRHPAVTLTIRAVWNGAASPLVSMLGKWLNPSQPWVLRIWISGVVFLSFRLAWLAVGVASLRRSGVAAAAPIRSAAAGIARRMGVRRVIRVLVSAIPDGPSVLGWFRPAILLPAATILNLTPDQLEAILAHEIAHLRRYDDVVNIVQSVIETLLFYHPAVWWLSNRIRHERELCCDDLAVQAAFQTGCGALCYARALAALEALRIRPAGLTLGALGSAASPLEYRIRRIVGAGAAPGRNIPRDVPSALPGLVALGLTLASAAIYSSTANGSAPAASLHTHTAYPESARLNGIQGMVPVEVNIDPLGHVRGASAIGGPRELRQAAVESASALQFAPEAAATAQVDVAFELNPPASAPAPALAVSAPEPQPARSGPRWRDKNESAIGLAADTERDPAKQLDLLAEWEQLYPNSEFRLQRAFMMAHALLSVLGAAWGQTDPAVLDAGRKAALQLAEHFDEYLDDSVKPDSFTPEEWSVMRKTSELQIHMILAYIAQTNRDNDTADVELTKVLALDPDQAGASYRLGETIVREVAAGGDRSRYSEALYDFAHALAVTGPTELPPGEKIAGKSLLERHYTAWHGSEDGLDELVKQAGESAFPPAGFHIANAVPPHEPELWGTTRIRLLEQGDDSFAGLRAAALPMTFEATVVSQLSSSRILVRVGNAPAGDAILRFDSNSAAVFRPGTMIRFTGIADSYSQNPYSLTFVIRNPADDIVAMNVKRRTPGRLLTRVFSGFTRFFRHLA